MASLRCVSLTRSEPNQERSHASAAPRSRSRRRKWTAIQYCPADSNSDAISRYGFASSVRRRSAAAIARSDAVPEGELAERKLKQRPAQPLDASELEKAGV